MSQGSRSRLSTAASTDGRSMRTAASTSLLLAFRELRSSSPSRSRFAQRLVQSGRNLSVRKPRDGGGGTVAHSLKTASARPATIHRCRGSASSTGSRSRCTTPNTACRISMPLRRPGCIDRDRLARDSGRLLARPRGEARSRVGGAPPRRARGELDARPRRSAARADRAASVA